MSASPAGQRVTPAQVLLIVVVSGLVLLFIALLMGRLTDGDRPVTGAPTAPGADPSSGGTALAGEEESDEPRYFTSPTGNIVCSLTVESADCLISRFDYEPEDAACEDDDAGGHLRVEPTGASLPCEPIVVAGDVPILDYGQTTTAHGYTCQSEESGVTCRHDESGYGFTVARSAYRLF